MTDRHFLLGGDVVSRLGISQWRRSAPRTKLPSAALRWRNDYGAAAVCGTRQTATRLRRIHERPLLVSGNESVSHSRSVQVGGRRRNASALCCTRCAGLGVACYWCLIGAKVGTMREIHIAPVLNGFVCTVGCQQVVFESRAKLLVELERYLSRPQMTEQEYLEHSVNPPGPGVAMGPGELIDPGTGRRVPRPLPPRPDPTYTEGAGQCSATQTAAPDYDARERMRGTATGAHPTNPPPRPPQPDRTYRD